MWLKEMGSEPPSHHADHFSSSWGERALVTPEIETLGFLLVSRRKANKHGNHTKKGTPTGEGANVWIDRSPTESLLLGCSAHLVRG